MNRNITPHSPQPPRRDPPPKIDALLDRLGTDDAYRAKFLADPAAALAEFGIFADASLLPATRKLPSKAELLDESSAVRAKLAIDWSDILFFFNAPPPSSDEKKDNG